MLAQQVPVHGLYNCFSQKSR